MLNILIVEDDSQLAQTLKYLVEDNPRYRVVGMAEDADRRARGGRGTPSRPCPPRPSPRQRVDRLFGRRPPQRSWRSMPVRQRQGAQLPDARPGAGCLMKPFTADDVHRSLAMAEDLLRGRETLRPQHARQSDALRERGTARTGGGGLHPLQAVAENPARALDLRAATTRASSSPAWARAGPTSARSAALRHRAAPAAVP